MKVLFLTSEGFDTPNSINHLCETLLHDMLKAGVEIHSISSHKTGQYSDIPEQLLKYSGFTYDIIKRQEIDKNNFVRRYIDEFKYAVSARKIWKKHKHEYDVILLQSNPNSVFNAFFLSALKKPIVLNLYDVFPGHAMSIGVIKNKFVFNALRVLQRALYRKCTLIIAMSDDMKGQLLLEKVPENKIKVINNWFDDEIFVPIERTENKFFVKYNLDTSKFYVQFAGLLGHVFDYKLFLDVAEELSNDSEIVFLLIGGGNQQQVIYKEIALRNLDNIKIFPWQPLDMIADVYNACDLGFIPLKPGVIGNGIPSKACQLMAAKRVVVNSVEHSSYTELFEAFDMGVNVTNRDAKTIATVIRQLLIDDNRRRELGENASKYAREHYSRSINTAKFIELLFTL